MTEPTIEPAALNDDQVRLLARIAEASNMLNELCHGRKFTMSVPVHDDDPDLVIGGGLQAGIEALGQLAALRGRVADLEMMLRATLDSPLRLGNSGKNMRGERTFVVTDPSQGQNFGYVLSADERTGLPVLTDTARKALRGEAEP